MRCVFSFTPSDPKHQAVEVTKSGLLGTPGPRCGDDDRIYGGGWVTGGTARTMSAMAESSGRMSVLVPLCVAQFTAADGAVAKFRRRAHIQRTTSSANT
jgi:hypothetical protein